MPRPSSPISLLFSCTLAVVVCPAARAQGSEARDHHHDEGHLHFSHPMVIESPSPDTKLRLDYAWARTGQQADRARKHSIRVEGEYAFTPAVSLAVTLPYEWLSSAGSPDANSLANTELSLKAASLRWGERGLLVGGGISVGLPTGSDERGIGTSRAIELEPFVDIAVKRGGLEVVGFGHYGTTVHNAAGMDAERELAFDGSVLYPLSSSVEALVELEAVRPVAGEERATIGSIAPGLKLYPFASHQLMFGVSAPLGFTSEPHDARGLLVSAFYHF